MAPASAPTIARSVEWASQSKKGLIGERILRIGGSLPTRIAAKKGARITDNSLSRGHHRLVTAR